MFLKLILLLHISAFYTHATQPLVKTPLGSVKGYIKTSFDGRKFAAFEGIPYAKPPTENRRFEPPEPIEPWIGTWEALHLTECAQTGFLQPNVTQGGEDCLHVNVYVPRENPNPSEKLDVIVHIHGGAYIYGSGHFYANPQILMDQDVIFVTFNYRIGILGFLSTEDDAIPGNMGMKDQVLALKWVQNNIESFGGNPGSVTLTGLSAGGSSVHLHYFSEMSKGLFHRGFAQSGVALTPWTLQEEALKKAQRLAEAVGCPSNPTRLLVDCLKQRPWKHLVEKMGLFFGFRALPLVPFGPVVEKGSNPFLGADPYNLLTKRKVLDLPLIISTTAHEGTVALHAIMEELGHVSDNWDSIAPLLLEFEHTLPQSQHGSASQKIREFYLGQDQKIHQSNMDKFVQMLTDRHFLADAEVSARLQSAAVASPIFYYVFNYLGERQKTMVGHGDDALYFFGPVSVFKDVTPLTDNEKKMKNLLVDMLVSYAKTGTPMIRGVEWKPTKANTLTYLNVSCFEPEGIKLQTADGLGQRKFWVSLGMAENENLVDGKDEL